MSGGERADGRGPDAVLALGHRMRLAVELAGDGHGLRIGCRVAERDGAISADFRRHDRWPAAAAACARGWRAGGGRRVEAVAVSGLCLCSETNPQNTERRTGTRTRGFMTHLPQ